LSGSLACGVVAPGIRRGKLPVVIRVLPATPELQDAALAGDEALARALGRDVSRPAVLNLIA
jgi:hypothetical protein